MENILKQKRLEKGMTLEDVGNLVGVGKSTVRKWENGLIENMGRDKIVALSKALDLSPLVILGIENINVNKSDINQILSVLEPKRQKAVYEFAKKQLQEQEQNNIYTIAAHSDDPNKKVTKEEFEHINSELDKLDRKFDSKQD